MELPQDVIADVRRRLHRVVGQVQGVERMWGKPLTLACSVLATWGS